MNVDVKFGIKVNGAYWDFTEQILGGEKTIETGVDFKNNVNKVSLHDYVVEREREWHLLRWIVL